MPECSLIANCAFFNDKMANKPGTAEMMKKKYCKEQYTDCARYVVCKALGRDKVPADLFPIQTDRATEMLKRAGKVS